MFQKIAILLLFVGVLNVHSYTYDISTQSEFGIINDVSVAWWIKQSIIVYDESNGAYAGASSIMEWGEIGGTIEYQGHTINFINDEIVHFDSYGQGAVNWEPRLTDTINVYIDFSQPQPAETEIYDFSDIIHGYDGLEPALIVLQYQNPLTGEWMNVEGSYVQGKLSILDPSMPYSFGSYDLPEGIVNWQHGYIFGENPEIESYRDTHQNNVGNIHVVPDENGDLNNIGGVQLVTIVSPPTVIQSTTGGGTAGSPPTSVSYNPPSSVVESASGLPNVASSTNEAFNTAVEVAAGMRLAKPDITDAVREGVSGLLDALDGLESADGISSDDIASGVASGLGVDQGTQFDIPAFDPTGSTIGTNFVDGISGSMDTALTALERLTEIVIPSFPTSLGVVSSISVNIAGVPGSINFPNFSVPRAIMTWGIHVLFWVSAIMIIRTGVA